MIINYIERKINQVIRHSAAWLETRFKQWTKPATGLQVIGTLVDLKRSKRELIAENMFLRQQLIVLERQVARPRMTQRDRQTLVLLASRIRGWREALIVVKPDTLIGWHRLGFRLFWRRKSRVRQGRPLIPVETIALIEEMAIHNRTWQAKRIQGELLKLGIKVSKETIRKYIRRARQALPPLKRSQTWTTFLANHASETWACDFVQTYDLFFRTVFMYFIIELDSRKVVHYGVTRSPSDGWVAQQAREATPYAEGPRFLIRDNDTKYGQCFTRVAEDRQIMVLKTPVEAPQANAICERFIGSVRRECLDHILILSERHLNRVIGEYVAYFNHARPHQGIGQRIPDPPEDTLSADMALPSRIVGYPVLGGLHHNYRQAA